MICRFHLSLVVLGVLFIGLAPAQEDENEKPGLTDGAIKINSPSDTPDPSTTSQMKDSVGRIAKQTEEEAAKIAKKVDQDPNAKTAAAGILRPIYAVAKAMAFPAFHWLAFSLMCAGVVSYFLQLALGKLVVLMRLGFSVKEIASDAVGLAISAVGLVLTTQAATESSSFTQSPAAIISATAVGVLAGFVLYLWGQSQELEAAAGRSRTVGSPKK